MNHVFNYATVMNQTDCTVTCRSTSRHRQ